MTFLPVAWRELAVAARQSRTYYARVQMGVAALLLGGYFLLMLNAMGIGAMAGRAAFAASASIAFYVCLFIGASATSDCLSVEKRDGTLGLLFLTDLRAYDILTGKLASTGLHLLYVLLAAVPAFAVPLLAGGVSAEMVLGEAVVLVNTLFFSCAVGLFVSACLRQARRARATAILSVLAITTLPYLVAHWAEWRGWPAAAVLGVSQFSPAAAQQGVFALGTGGSGGHWPTVFITHAYAWLLLVLAGWTLPRSWQERPPGIQRQRWLAHWREWQVGAGARGVARRGQLLAAGPFHFLGARNRFRHLGLWVTLVALGVVFVGLPWLSGGSWLDGMPILMALTHLTIKFWFASDAASTLTEQRRSGAFELLLSTPLSTQEILRGHWRTLLVKFIGPGVLAVGLNLILGEWATVDRGNADDRALIGAILVGTVVTLVADLWALGWTAMWLAMSSANPNRAAGDAVARIVVLPWVLLGLGSAAVAVLRLIGGGVPMSDGPWLLFGAWFGLGIGVDLLFGLRSRGLLIRRFRECAERQFLGIKAGWLARLLRLGRRTG